MLPYPLSGGDERHLTKILFEQNMETYTKRLPEEATSWKILEIFLITQIQHLRAFPAYIAMGA